MALLRRAIFAEVYQSPSVVELSQGQIEIAENAWGNNLFDALLEKFDEERALQVLDAMDSPTAQNSKDSCEGLQTVFDTLDEMEGIAGDWMRRKYLNYVLDGI
ncbi:MAG: hypothetical protein ACO391_15000 [Pseudomonadales bacterium]